MKQKKKISWLIIFGFTLFIALFFLYFVCQQQSYKVYAASDKVTLQSETLKHSETTFEQYEKGDRTVNILVNFINYKDDYTNHFTQSEIDNILSGWIKDLNDYFMVMSQNYITLDVDYVVCVAPKTYEEYLAMDDANYSIESSLFANSLVNAQNYNGDKKNFKFDKFNVRVNAFAGEAGEWSTFLWPHAYSSQSLITMLENSKKGNMPYLTLCHELFHVFGIGDLYSYGTPQSFSAQNLDIMGTSSTRLTTNAYFRNKLGWIETSVYNDNKTTHMEEIPSTQKGSLTVDVYANSTKDYSKTIAYKFGENISKNEFFVLEFRLKNHNGFDTNIISTGVVLYRINTTAYGNSQGHTNTAYSEVIYLGDSSVDMSSTAYTETCLQGVGATYGTRGSVTNKSLVYSGGKGKANLFTGDNSGISVKVESFNGEKAKVTITFAQDKSQIDCNKMKWDYDGKFSYNGKNKTVALTNIPANLGVTYIGTQSAKNAGTYKARVEIDFDKENFELINFNISSELTWVISPAQIKIIIDAKSSMYGESLKDLTYRVQGTVYNNDSLNVQLTKQSGTNVGTYDITGRMNNNNYNATFENGSYEITKRIISIKLYDQTYNKSSFVAIDNLKYEILTTDYSLIDGDDLDIVIITKNEQISDAGTYALTAITNNENYFLEVDEANLIIVDVKAKYTYETKVLIGTAIGIGTVLAGIVIAIIRRRIRVKKIDIWF